MDIRDGSGQRSICRGRLGAGLAIARWLGARRWLLRAEENECDGHCGYNHNGRYNEEKRAVLVACFVRFVHGIHPPTIS